MGIMFLQDGFPKLIASVRVLLASFAKPPRFDRTAISPGISLFSLQSKGWRVYSSVEHFIGIGDGGSTEVDGSPVANSTIDDGCGTVHLKYDLTYWFFYSVDFSNSDQFWRF